MRQVLGIVFAGILAIPAVAQETTVEAAAEAAAPAVTSEAPVTEAAAPVEEAAAEAVPVLVPLQASEVTLAEFQWIKRPIAVFADTPADPRFKEQLDLLLERPEELLARDVVLIVDSDPNAGTAIRKKLRPRGFMLALLGKDGTVNLRKPFPWDVREITHAIDKWPLRQQEIRDAKAAAAAAE